MYRTAPALHPPSCKRKQTWPSATSTPRPGLELTQNLACLHKQTIQATSSSPSLDPASFSIKATGTTARFFDPSVFWLFLACLPACLPFAGTFVSFKHESLRQAELHISFPFFFFRFLSNLFSFMSTGLTTEHRPKTRKRRRRWQTSRGPFAHTRGKRPLEERESLEPRSSFVE